ncbi:uncharacterized protein Dwil_GK13694 [Drosophila willistoni]|uniref:PHD-type domain-containing protein n=1 Tax=Drosophila willistoni TaxID=7260 RepID=B4NHM3_DROWI|nr:uncharacterized protein Dwil_GK13694 [Drosophila willistoni]
MRIIIAQIAQNIGYSSTQNAPLELLQDILQKFMQEFAHDLHSQMEHANRIEPTLKDARLTLKSLNINVHELLDYIGNVEPVPFVRDVPAFPVKRASNLNFLKPGSAETLTRPVYIFEYLPPMQPNSAAASSSALQAPYSDQEQEGADGEATKKVGSQEGLGNSGNPNETASSAKLLNFPAKDNCLDMEGHTVREIRSVVMTSGGFISPAIEGKLPESVIPDIIVKLKGLDAPPPPPPSRTAALTPKATKKNKKQKHLIGGAGGTPGDKAHDKAQRKAMKMYQKLSKNHSDSGNALMLVKKSKKHLNRGVIPTLPDGSADRAQLEKLFKKQAKQKQKRQQQLGVKPFGYVDGLGGSNTSLTEESSVSFAPLTVEKVVQPVPNPEGAPIVGECEAPHGLKLASEPDKNKLNIFKKISKQKLSAPTASAPGLTLFGHTAAGPPLISLPSGTTITPAPPALNVTIESHMNNATQQLQQFSPMTISTSGPTNQDSAPTAPSFGVEIVNIDANKPKKRGRKPGGKNQAKQLLNPLVMQPLPKKMKASKTMLGVLGQPLSLGQSSDPSALVDMEPLNLSHVPQFQDNLMQPKNKEKKERKKYKSTKYDPPLPLPLQAGDSFTPDDMHMRISPTKRITQGPVNILGVGMGMPGLPPGPGLYANNQLPLLPLLSFPPRPGLIPSGPGLFSAATGGLPSFGQSSVPIPPFMQFPGGTVSIDSIPNRPMPMNPTDIKPIGYCPVAPLVPESMKLTSPEVQKISPFSSKLKSLSATGNLGDPIEVSDDSDESAAAPASIKTSQLSPAVGGFDGLVGRPNIIQPSQLPYTVAGTPNLISPVPAASTKSDTINQLPITPMPRNTPIFDPSPAVSKKLKKQTKPCDLPTALPSPNPAAPTGPSISPSPFNLHSLMGSDKYSLAGGADLIPLSRVESGLAYSSQTVPVTSLAVGATSGTSAVPPAQLNLNVSEEIQAQRPHQPFMPNFGSFEDITITPANPALNIAGSADELRSRKLHKKLKKPKEGKIKKKKDKKDKSKSKERLITSEFSLIPSEKPAKGQDKKPKKDKKKDKLQQQIPSVTVADSDSIAVPPQNSIESIAPTSAVTSSLAPVQTVHISNSPQLELSPNQVPKLTLKLSGKSTPLPMEPEPTLLPQIGSGKKERDRGREPSPELARFSPLVTGPPKPKQSDLQLSLPTSASASTSGPPMALPLQMSTIPNTHTLVPSSTAVNSSVWMTTGSGAPAAATLSASSVLLPQQLMLASTPTPIPSSGGAVIAPTATVSPAKSECPPPQTVESNRPSSYVDAEGNRIWICPACGKVDDGSAMIGCDGCDAWYHWICVGIQVAPKDNDDWFCRVCITRKKVHGSEKKKKRNKKK